MITSNRPVVRFAPSPNGYLHLGHAYSALFSNEMARLLDGRCLLRIEDIDVGRCRPEFSEAIFEDLTWLGLDWPEPVLSQSDHFADYQAAVDKLDTMGVLYPCFASRREIDEAVCGTIVPRDPDGAPLYPGLFRDLPRELALERIAAGEPFALRLNMAAALERARAMAGGANLKFYEVGESLLRGGGSSEAGMAGEQIVARPERWGDVVIRRKDVPTSYHLSVVIDDARQGVTHVTRGLDLYAATDVHRLLQVLLGLEAPVYAHHRLISDDLGGKLSKSKGDTSLRVLRAAGVRRADILEVFAKFAHV